MKINCFNWKKKTINLWYKFKDIFANNLSMTYLGKSAPLDRSCRSKFIYIHFDHLTDLYNQPSKRENNVLPSLGFRNTQTPARAGWEQGPIMKFRPSTKRRGCIQVLQLFLLQVHQGSLNWQLETSLCFLSFFLFRRLTQVILNPRRWQCTNILY